MLFRMPGIFLVMAVALSLSSMRFPFRQMFFLAVTTLLSFRVMQLARISTLMCFTWFRYSLFNKVSPLTVSLSSGWCGVPMWRHVIGCCIILELLTVAPLVSCTVRFMWTRSCGKPVILSPDIFKTVTLSSFWYARDLGAQLRRFVVIYGSRSKLNDSGGFLTLPRSVLSPSLILPPLSTQGAGRVVQSLAMWWLTMKVKKKRTVMLMTLHCYSLVQLMSMLRTRLPIRSWFYLIQDCTQQMELPGRGWKGCCCPSWFSLWTGSVARLQFCQWLDAYPWCSSVCSTCASASTSSCLC